MQAETLSGPADVDNEAWFQREDTLGHIRALQTIKRKLLQKYEK